MAKQYGLIKKSNVFGSDSEEESSTTAVKKQPLLNMLQKKQIQKMHEQAVEEDPNIFLYDEVFDDIQNKRNEIKNQKKAQEDKKPKYIKKLMETADKRKKEYERRVERQVQKEREAEGEKFKDKEIFVTSTYRKKLEEIKEAELEEKRQEYLESIGDVTKQADLSGFYRHLYSQKLENEPLEVDSKPKEVNPKAEETTSKRIHDTSQNKKNYRKRESSNDEEAAVSEKTETTPAKTEHLNSNLDADSDFSVDSSSEESDSENKKQSEKKLSKEEGIFKEPMKPQDKTELIESKNPVVTETKIEDEIEEVEIEPKKPKIDIWAKRTVGELYVEAVKRYYERKAMKESSMS